MLYASKGIKYKGSTACYTYPYFNITIIALYVTSIQPFQNLTLSYLTFNFSRFLLTPPSGKTIDDALARKEREHAALLQRLQQDYDNLNQQLKDESQAAERRMEALKEVWERDTQRQLAMKEQVVGE